jgi:hypothetical protein
MNAQEKIFSLARECGIKNRVFPQSEVWGYEHNIEAFYHAAQAEAFEQAAQKCEEVRDQSRHHLFRSSAEICAYELREIRKEQK